MSLQGEGREERRLLRAEVVGGLPGGGGSAEPESTKLWGDTLAWSLGFLFSFIKFRFFCLFVCLFLLPSPAFSLLTVNVQVWLNGIKCLLDALCLLLKRNKGVGFA